MAVIKVKASNDAKYDVTVQDLAGTSVTDFKGLIATASGIPADQLRLIYSGKVLKDPDMLSVYKVGSIAPQKCAHV
jgi:ubiquilin